MAYATLDQLVSLFGADEIRTLSDRQGTGELDEAVISDALERASSEVDSYLADRYATPLSGSDPIPPWWFRLPGTSPGIGSPGATSATPIPSVSVTPRRLIGCATSRTARLAFPGLPPAGTETPGAVLLEPGTRPWDGVAP